MRMMFPNEVVASIWGYKYVLKEIKRGLLYCPSKQVWKAGDHCQMWIRERFPPGETGVEAGWKAVCLSWQEHRSRPKEKE